MTLHRPDLLAYSPTTLEHPLDAEWDLKIPMAPRSSQSVVLCGDKAVLRLAGHRVGLLDLESRELTETEVEIDPEAHAMVLGGQLVCAPQGPTRVRLIDAETLEMLDVDVPAPLVVKHFAVVDGHRYLWTLREKIDLETGSIEDLGRMLGAGTIFDGRHYGLIRRDDETREGCYCLTEERFLWEKHGLFDILDRTHDHRLDRVREAKGYRYDLVDTQTENTVWTRPLDPQGITRATIVGDRLLTVSHFGDLRLFDLASGETIGPPRSIADRAAAAITGNLLWFDRTRKYDAEVEDLVPAQQLVACRLSDGAEVYSRDLKKTGPTLRSALRPWNGRLLRFVGTRAQSFVPAPREASTVDPRSEPGMKDFSIRYIFAQDTPVSRKKVELLEKRLTELGFEKIESIARDGIPREKQHFQFIGDEHLSACTIATEPGEGKVLHPPEADEAILAVLRTVFPTHAFEERRKTSRQYRAAARKSARARRGLDRQIDVIGPPPPGALR